MLLFNTGKLTKDEEIDIQAAKTMVESFWIILMAYLHTDAVVGINFK